MKISSPRSFINSSRACIAWLTLAAAAVVLSSCRTTEGFGRDLQKVGNKIENEAYRRG